MKLNRKGFTLVELIAVVFIISLIIGLSTYGIINFVNSSKEKSKVLSEESILDAASTYATEKNNDNSYWLDISDQDNKYFCVTIEELMNKGLLDKKADIKSDNYNKYSYVTVRKNKVTFVNSKAEILADTNSNDYKICSGSTTNEEVTSYPKLNTGNSYTDEIHVPFSDAKTNPSSNIIEKVCMYGDSTANIKYEGKIEGNTCKLEGLKQNSTYYLRVCMKTERNSYLCSNTESRSTKIISKPTYTNSVNVLNIKYSTSNIIGEAKYYFKSTLNGTSKSNVEKCTLNNDIFTCSGSSTTIEKNVWYRTSNKNISITYNTSGSCKVTARTVDKSNNYSESSKKFTIYKRNITFKKGSADKIDGGTSDITKSCYAIDSNKCSITSPSIERKGCSVIGWNTSSTSTTSSWNVNTKKNINANATYYPITKINKVIIRFSTNNGNLKNSTTTNSGNVYKWRETNNVIERTKANGNEYFNEFFTINYGEQTASDGLPNYNYSKYLSITKTGYSAVPGEEWKCLGGCTTSQKTYDQTVVYKANDFCDASKNDCIVTLGVNWKVNTYTITYKANGGNGSVQTQNVTYGEKWTTKDKLFTKTGYTQVGWNTKADGTGDTYSLNKLQNAKKVGNLTLYAKWQINKVIVRFNINGGTLKSKTTFENVTYNWTSNSSGTISRQKGSGTATTDFFTIKYGGETGSSGLPNRTDSSTYLNITKSGYTTVSNKTWVCKSGCTTSGKIYDQTTVYKASDFCDASSNNCTVELNANWKQVYTITYDANGGTGAPPSQTKVYGESMTISSTKPTRTGYTFVNWNSKSDGSGSSYTPGTAYTSLASTTLYAVWKANTYTITYKANGGSGADQTQDVTYGSNWTTKDATFSRTGHTQTSWNTSTNGRGTTYSLNKAQGTKGEGDITLYAIWKANTYKITYDANGGSGAPSPQEYVYNDGGNIYLSSTVPTRGGYTFLGWSLKRDATSASYSAGQWWGTHNTNNYTLYAIWKVIPSCNGNHSWKARGIKIFNLSKSYEFECGDWHSRAYAIYCSKCGMSALYYKTHGLGSTATLTCPDRPSSDLTTRFNDCNLSYSELGNNMSGGENSLQKTNDYSC